MNSRYCFRYVTKEKVKFNIDFFMERGGNRLKTHWKFKFRFN